VPLRRASCRLGSLLAELRRRHVVQVGVVYGAMVFAVLQGADIIFPVLGIPDWIFRLLVISALLAFPVVLVLAWAYDLTPDGIVRVDDVPPGADEVAQAQLRRGARVGLLLLSGVMAIGLAWLSFRWAVSGAEALSPLNPKAIAVLPFEDLNRNDSTAFFAAGMHDDVINHLTRIRDLTVISRTSVLPYAGSALSIPEIARELGVGTILEGSVRSSGNRIRVVAQLIDARTDGHLWSGSYDRELSDVFALQTEIAEQIAEALQAELSAEERERMEQAPTDNLEAYSAYLQGRVFSDRRDELDQAVQAVEALQEAVRLDPEFAVAWAALARARMWLFWTWPGFGDQAERAVDALEKARELAPESAETRLAAGYLDFYGQGDPDRALRDFMDVQRLRPSDAEAATAVGMVLRRRGAWEPSLRAFLRAQEVDPRSYTLALAVGQLHGRMRNVAEAEPYLQQAVGLAPGLAGGHGALVQLALGGRGDTVAAREVLERVPGGVDPVALDRLRVQVALYRGDVAGAVEILEAGQPRDFRDLALARFLAGELDGAQEAALELQRKATGVVEGTGSGGAVQTQVVARAHAERGVAEAILGNRAAAVREATTAVALLPMSEDAWSGAEHVLALALVYTLIGEQEAALDRIEELLRVPSPLSLHDLRLHPVWRLLGENPRMEDLLAGA
jgi:TolB-like protein/Tfp pilus assembly protein PilF